MTINLILLTPSLRTRIYTTVLDFSRHLLTNYTLLDNYRASNLVNDKKLLVLSSFVKLTSNEYVKAGTSRILILRRSKRLLLKVLEGLDRARTTDLVLNDVVIIEGFYVNIISKARLLEAGL